MFDHKFRDDEIAWTWTGLAWNRELLNQYSRTWLRVIVQEMGNPNVVSEVTLQNSTRNGFLSASDDYVKAKI